MMGNFDINIVFGCEYSGWFICCLFTAGIVQNFRFLMLHVVDEEWDFYGVIHLGKSPFLTSKYLLNLDMVYEYVICNYVASI